MASSDRIPVHIVAGPLGVGKTTAILRYVQRQAGREHVAVLVNDYGPVGMDGSILGGSPGGAGMELLSIPGGCLCCASADALAAGIPKLASLPGVTRIIIEPSGLAMPAQVVDLLRRLAAGHALDVRPTIVLIDAAEFRAELAEHMPYYRRLVESADVLVANRADKADAKAVARFEAWAAGLFPPKLRVVVTEHGELPDEVFTLQSAATPASGATTHEHTHPLQAHGQVWPADAVFDADGVEQAIRAAQPARFKGIFHTTRGWLLLQWARGELAVTPTEHRRDSRAEWIGGDTPMALPRALGASTDESELRDASGINADAEKE